jgi:Tol biopolymer transport system component
MVQRRGARVWAVAWVVWGLAACNAPRPEVKPSGEGSGAPGLNLYRLVVAGRVGAPPPKLVVANGAGDDDSGRIAPDGNWFAFRTHRAGAAEIWIARKDGSGARRLAAGMDEMGAPSWSPDAKWVVFQARKSGVLRLFAASPSTPGLREIPTPPTPSSHPVFSRDGKSIYFTQPAAGGGGQVARVGFDGQGYAVVREAATEAEESGSDGVTLYYSSGPSSGVFGVPLAGGKPKQVTPLGGDRQWALSREALFVLDAQQKAVVRIDLKTGHQSTAFPLPAAFRMPATGRALDVAADETWYLLPLDDGGATGQQK